MKTLDRNAIVLSLFLIACVSIFFVETPKDIVLAICSGLIGALKTGGD